jgi:hypothetical protein
MPPKKDTAEESQLQQDHAYLPPSHTHFDDDTDRAILDLVHQHKVLDSVTGPASMASKDEKWAIVVRELSALCLQRQKELCTRYLQDYSQWQATMKSRESQGKKGRGYPPPKPSLKRLKYQFDTQSVTYRFKNMSDKYLRLVKQFGLYRHQLAGESGGGREVDIDSKLAEAEKEWGLVRVFHNFFGKLPQVDASLCTALGLPNHGTRASQAPTGARTRRRPAEGKPEDETTRLREFRQAFFYGAGSDDVQDKLPLDVGSDTNSDSECPPAGTATQAKADAKSCDKQARASKQTAGTSGAAGIRRPKVSAEADAAKGTAIHIGPKRQRYSLGRSRSEAQREDAAAGLKEQLEAHHKFTQVRVSAFV